MAKVKVCVLRTAGTNCDKETAFAFIKAGAEIELVHINQLISGQKDFADYQVLALPGGFSYGDDVAAGKILANELKCSLQVQLREFIRQGKLIIGICNGFQILVKAGFLPGNADLEQEASLILNDSVKFEDRWVYLRGQGSGVPSTALGAGKGQGCVWTRWLPPVIYLPVAHGEGKFVVKDDSVLQRLKKHGQIVFQYSDAQGKLPGYPDNPNGSTHNIAGICDETGRILGLMPHPERHILPQQHPGWTSTGARGKKENGDGLQIFRNGVGYAKKL